jgi:hypothetical protein
MSLLQDLPHIRYDFFIQLIKKSTNSKSWIHIFSNYCPIPFCRPNLEDFFNCTVKVVKRCIKTLDEAAIRVSLEQKISENTMCELAGVSFPVPVGPNQTFPCTVSKAEYGNQTESCNGNFKHMWHNNRNDQRLCRLVGPWNYRRFRQNATVSRVVADFEHCNGGRQSCDTIRHDVTFHCFTWLTAPYCNVQTWLQLWRRPRFIGNGGNAYGITSFSPFFHQINIVSLFSLILWDTCHELVWNARVTSQKRFSFLFTHHRSISTSLLIPCWPSLDLHRSWQQENVFVNQEKRYAQFKRRIFRLLNLIFFCFNAIW